MADPRKRRGKGPLEEEDFIGMSPPQEGRRRPPPERPARKPGKKRRGPLGPGKRLLILIVCILLMAAITAAFCIFLVFKVAEIQVTGDSVYSAQEITDLCGYEIGENLVFLTTEDREQRLESQLPYVQEAQITRHLPNTLEIHITGAQVQASVETAGGWLWVSDQGKILELGTAPAEGTMMIRGYPSLTSQPGQFLSAEDQTLQAVLMEILGKLSDLEILEDCTRLDLTDLYDIRLWYQDRVECKLGSTAGVAYKLEFARKLFTESPGIGAQETGVLDLSYADTHNAGFLAGPIELEDWTGSAAQTTPEGGDENAGATQEGEDGRGGDIPNGIFDGDGIVSSTPEESAQDTGETQTTDGTQDSDGPQGTEETWEDPSQETGSGTSEGGDRGGDIPGELFGGEEESSSSAGTVDRGGDIPSDIFTG